MRSVAVAEFVLGAFAGWAFVVSYHVRTRGGWRRSPLGWHLMTFTACLALIFTLAVAVRVVEIPGIHLIAVLLYGFVVVSLWWRLALQLAATRNHRERRQ